MQSATSVITLPMSFSSRLRFAWCQNLNKGSSPSEPPLRCDVNELMVHLQQVRRSDGDLLSDDVILMKFCRIRARLQKFLGCVA
jgi:hypothetical protein